MPIVEDAPHKDITYKVIGAAMAVHNDLGMGHREDVYQQALALKMIADPYYLVFQVECNLPVYNEDHQLVFVYRADFCVEQKVLVEIKAHTQPINQDEIAQVFDYFAASDCPVALLINFGRLRLEYKRLFPPTHIQSRRQLKKGSGN
jgi:GxxExxY protein